MKVVQNEISFPSYRSSIRPLPSLTQRPFDARKDNIIPSAEAFSTNNMEELDTSSIHIRLHRGEASLVGLVFRSFDHASGFLLSKQGGREKYRRETTLAPPLSRWRKGRVGWKNDKSKRNTVDDALWCTVEFSFPPSLFHLDRPSYTRFPSDRPFPKLLSLTSLFSHISLNQLS